MIPLLLFAVGGVLGGLLFGVVGGLEGTVAWLAGIAYMSQWTRYAASE